MAISQVVYHWSDQSPKDTLQSACYFLLRDIRPNTTKKKKFITYFRLDTWNITVKRANWFLYNFVLPNIPERIKSKITFKRIFRKGMQNHFGINAATGKSQYDYIMHTPRGIPWLQVEMDVADLHGRDCLVAMSLFREPQEEPELVNHFFKLTKTYPINVAYLLAHLNSHIMLNNNHNFLNMWSSLHQLPTQQEIAEFSFIKYWPKNWSQFDRVQDAWNFCKPPFPPNWTPRYEKYWRDSILLVEDVIHTYKGEPLENP